MLNEWILNALGKVTRQMTAHIDGDDKPRNGGEMDWTNNGPVDRAEPQPRQTWIEVNGEIDCTNHPVEKIVATQRSTLSKKNIPGYEAS